MGDQRLQPRQPVGDQQGDVAVAAELAQDRLGVPEHEVGLLGPLEVRVRRGERATLDVAARLLGRGARQLGRPRHLGDPTTSSPRMRRKAASTAAKRAATRSLGVAGSHDPGIAAAHEVRVEVEEGRDDDVRADRAHRARRATRSTPTGR